MSDGRHRFRVLGASPAVLLLLVAPAVRAQLELTGWFQAASAGDLTLLQSFVVDDGQDINEKTDFGDNSPISGSTALMYACLQGRLPAVQWLLDNGANVMAKDKLGNTPLHMAADTASDAVGAEIVGLLLQHGAQKTVRNNMDYTPFETVSVRQTDSEYRPGYTAGDIAQFAGKTQMAALLAT